MPTMVTYQSKDTADATLFGFYPGLEQLVCKVRGGSVVVGDVMMFDLLKADAASTTASAYASTSIFSNLIPPSAGAVLGTSPGIFAVCLEAAADDASCLVALSGPIDAMVIGAAGSMAIGTPLVATTSKNLDIVVATGEVVLGVGMAALATPTSRALGSVWFSGFYRIFGVSA